MDLESIVLSLNKKDHAAVEIHTEINHILGGCTVGYSTVTRFLRKQTSADSSTLTPENREIQGPHAIDNAILQALDEQPFVSLRQIAKGIDGSDVSSSIPFGEQDGIQIETGQMGVSRAIGGSETDPRRDIKKPLGFVAFYPAPGLKISCFAGRIQDISRIRTNKHGSRAMKIPRQLNAKRSAVRRRY